MTVKQAHRRHKQRKLKQGLLEGGSVFWRIGERIPADEERRFQLMLGRNHVSVSHRGDTQKQKRPPRGRNYVSVSLRVV